MPKRRDFLQMSLAAAAVTGASGLGQGGRLAAQDRFDQAALLAFEPLGQITLMHVSDIQAQVMPGYMRAPDSNIGIGDQQGRVPHLTGQDFRIRYGVGGGTPMDYALTHQDFEAHAGAYGKMGGLDRVATILRAIRAERPEALLLDGGDTWTGSLVSEKTKGQAMVDAMAVLRPDAMTLGHEFALGTQQLRALVRGLPFPVLAQNVFDAIGGELSSMVKPYTVFEREDVKIAVIGQANPFAGGAATGWAAPEFVLDVRSEQMQKTVDEARSKGAQVVVCLSQNGFAIDRKMAETIKGIDVILSGRSHHALPEPEVVGKTHIIASGSAGRFVSRIDLDVQDGALASLRHKLMPVFADLIDPDPEMAALIQQQRVPYVDFLRHEVGKTDALLYRRGTLASTWDDLLCDAVMSEGDAEIALSPSSRQGGDVLPGSAITREDILGVTGNINPNTYRSEMTGAALRQVLEDAADAAFHPDPFQRRQQDMLRTGGIDFVVDIAKPKGARISEMTLHSNGAAIDASKTYRIAGWALAQNDIEGPPMWEIVEDYVRKRGRVTPGSVSTVGNVLPD